MLEPMDVEQTVNWEKKPKKERKMCQYLKETASVQNKTKETDKADSKSKAITVLCLPSPPNQSSVIPLATRVKSYVPSNLLLFPRRINYTKILKILDPAFIIGIIHVLMNVFLSIILVYSVCHVIYFAKVDIQYKITMKKEEARAKIEEAKRLYKINKCDPTTRVPAMDLQCGQWECLIRTGFSGIKYMRIVAELLADVADGFVGRFRIRNLFVICAFSVLYLVFRRKGS